MKKLLREPLVHFLLIGAALFAVYFALNGEKAESPEDITITSGQIETLAVGFTRVWHRPPTSAELKELIDSHVKEEILSREAVKLGLDQNDTVIRRRLQQKMEFITEDVAAAREPTDAELAKYLANHPAKFATEPRFTFRQVFLSRERRGGRLETDAAAMLAGLRQRPTTDIGDLGDRLLLPQDFTEESLPSVVSQFGPEFATDLAVLTPGQWGGPIRSGYGAHLVLVTGRAEGPVPQLEEVRDRVRRELMDARRQEANRKLLDGLLAKYRVTIRQPPSDTTTTVRLSGIGP